MYGNVKNGPDANLKGEVGEVIAKYSLPQSISTKEFHHYILKKFNLSEEQLSFLQENWKSFDLVDPGQWIIYETKTRKYFGGKLKGDQNKPEISPYFLRIVEKAQALGFSIKVVDVTLFSDWRYGIVIHNFDKNHFRVRQRLSGWARQLKSKQHRTR